MRRTVVVLVLGLVVGGWPAASGAAHGATARQAASARSLQADFNNDGADDLAVGVPLDSVGAMVGAGAVNVLYGSPSGLSGTGSQLFTQVGGMVEAGDEFGFAVAAGDFNRDGFADLTVGAPFEGVGGAVEAGAVSVLPGAAGGLGAVGGRLFTQVGGAVEAGDEFGFALVAGDFNHDGFADLAAGAPAEDVGGTVDAGAVSVLPGSSGGLTAIGGRLFPQVGGAVETEDGFGAALAAGDFNHDAFADLGVGAPFEDVGGTVDAGAVSVLPGSAAGLSAVGGQLFTQDTPGVPGSAQELDLFGFALATGDPGPAAASGPPRGRRGRHRVARRLLARVWPLPPERHGCGPAAPLCTASGRAARGAPPRRSGSAAAARAA